MVNAKRMDERPCVSFSYDFIGGLMRAERITILTILTILFFVHLSWGQNSRQDLEQRYKTKLKGLEETRTSKELFYEFFLIGHSEKLKETYIKKGDLNSSLYMTAVINKELPEGAAPAEYIKLKAKYDQSLLKQKQSYDKAVLMEKKKVIDQGKNLIRSLVQAGKLAEAKNVNVYVKDLSTQIQNVMPSSQIVKPKRASDKKSLLTTVELFGKNLIKNPSNELPITDGKIQEWDLIEGDWQQKTAYPGPDDGRYFFFAGECARGILEQRIDLSAFPALENITFSMKASVRPYSESSSQIVVDFLKNNEVLKSFDSGKIVNSREWKKIELKGFLPMAAEELRVRLISQRGGGAPNNQGYFDNLSLVLGEPLGTIGAFFSSKEDIFTMDEKEFESDWSKKLEASWTGNLRNSARSTTTIFLGELTSKETVFDFRNEKLSKVALLFYNKGDQGVLREDDFNDLLDGVLKGMTTFVGQKPRFKPNAGLSKNKLYFWLKMPYLYKLEYSFSKTRKGFNAEYIRVSILPGSKKINAVNVDKENVEVLSGSDLRSLIKRNDSGSVYLPEIPMVDQGEKGYCACATIARLLNYYGRKIDQHDIANLALASGEKGTDIRNLKKSIEKISDKLRLHTSVATECYGGKELYATRLEKKISRELKRHDYPADKIFQPQELNEFLLILFLNDKWYEQFKKSIFDSIDSGRPLVWALVLGRVNEPKAPQLTGGHMRLIIGYNKEKDEIYYSDTWGEGHEKKTMPMASAFYASCALWEIRPR